LAFSSFIPKTLRIINLFVWFSLVVFVFILSILHLRKYDKKTFAIISLIFSSFGIFIGGIVLLSFAFLGVIESGLSKGITLLEQSDTIQPDYYLSQEVTVPDSYLEINYSSDNKSDIYLLNEWEYYRLSETNDSWYYLEGQNNTTNWYLKDYSVEKGKYYIVISNLQEDYPINYSLSIIYKLKFEAFD
jgi:hypothetical protein